MTPDEQEGLRVDIEKGDLDAYRKLETWGSSLFLGVLGLLGKQFVDWELNPETTKRLTLPTGFVLLPAVVGLAAFLFLRIVNFRSYRAGRNLRPAGRATRSGAEGLLGSARPDPRNHAVAPRVCDFLVVRHRHTGAGLIDVLAHRSRSCFTYCLDSRSRKDAPPAQGSVNACVPNDRA